MFFGFVFVCLFVMVWDILFLLTSAAVLVFLLLSQRPCTHNSPLKSSEGAENSKSLIIRKLF